MYPLGQHPSQHPPPQQQRPNAMAPPPSQGGPPPLPTYGHRPPSQPGLPPNAQTAHYGGANPPGGPQQAYPARPVPPGQLHYASGSGGGPTGLAAKPPGGAYGAGGVPGAPQALAPKAEQASIDRSRSTWPLQSLQVLRTNSPSLRDNLDDKRQAMYRYSYCEFLKQAGMALRFPQLTIATAVVFCHRFFSRHSFASRENDVKVIASACLFLAGKVEETPKPLSEVVSKTYIIRHNKEPKETVMEKIKRKEEFEEQKDRLLVAERQVLHALEFCFHVEHAYKHVLVTVRNSFGNNKEVAQVAWNFVNDSLRTLLNLQYDSQKIAVTVVHLASKFLKLEATMKSEDGTAWWSKYKITAAELEDISNQILDLYCQKGPEGASQVSSTSGEASTGKPAAAAKAARSEEASSLSAVRPAAAPSPHVTTPAQPPAHAPPPHPAQPSQPPSGHVSAGSLNGAAAAAAGAHAQKRPRSPEAPEALHKAQRTA